MINIFNSQKKLSLQTQADPNSVMAQFRRRIAEDSFGSRLKTSFSASGEFLGKIDRRNIEVRYYGAVRNSLQPTMHISVEDDYNGGSIIHTRYSTSIFVIIFWFIWMAGATFISVAVQFNRASDSSLFVLLFPVFGVLLLVLMRVFARADEVKLEKLVQDVVHSCDKR